jgi:FlaG protein
MTGNLLIAAQPSAPDLASRAPVAAHGSLAIRAHPDLRPQPGQEILADSFRPTESDRLEAGRLKALVTDPGLRVSLHQDEASGRVVMQVVNRATGEVVDQIPAEELLRLYSALREPLLDERA